MRLPDELTSDLWFSNPGTHLFLSIRIVRKPLDRRTLGVYGKSLDAANQKLRYAAESLQRLLKIIDSLECGEFIYFDDESRLHALSALESYLIFLRASLDLIVAAWWAFHTNKHDDLNSLNRFLKRLKKGIPWFPISADGQTNYWMNLLAEYGSSTFTWLDALVGANKGESLRDLAVHRAVLEIDPIIDDHDRGVFAIVLNSSSIGPAADWLKSIYYDAWLLIDTLILDIEASEALQQPST